MPQASRNVPDSLERLLAVLPSGIATSLRTQQDLPELIEVVLDLGRVPEARFPGRVLELGEAPVTGADLDCVTDSVGAFSDDNRAGLSGTLHRISCIRNRQGAVVGLTCRVGRAVQGTIDIIRDLVESGRSLLIMGRPGIGKTTKLREIARVLSEDFKKRVIVIDTSNEIAGDGDIPHPAIGRARRMQVPRAHLQHAVMIEAVENHMPEVIIVDEIGTEQEAAAARTIAERGVQLIGTAHGNSLENLLMNPTLSDLVGGIQSVTLGDEEARRRGTQKTILERKAPPTFDLAVELQDRDRLAVHGDVAEVVDQLLRGIPPTPEIRQLDAEGVVQVTAADTPDTGAQSAPMAGSLLGRGRIRVFPFAVSRSQLERVIRSMRMPVEITKHLEDADALFILKAYVRSGTRILQDAESRGLPVYVVKANTVPQIQRTLREAMRLDVQMISDEDEAIREARSAIDMVLKDEKPLELRPRSAALRRLQHELAEKHALRSQSLGDEPNRRVCIYPVSIFED